MNKVLIKQQLEAFSGWLKVSSDLELKVSSLLEDNLPEETRHIGAANAYHDAWDLFLKVKEHIEKLMEDFDVLDPADDPDKVHDLDVMDPVDYIDKYGVTFFGDREE